MSATTENQSGYEQLNSKNELWKGENVEAASNGAHLKPAVKHKYAIYVFFIKTEEILNDKNNPNAY